MIFVYILVEGSAEWDVSLDAGNPFVDAAFDLKARH